MDYPYKGASNTENVTISQHQPVMLNKVIFHWRQIL